MLRNADGVPAGRTHDQNAAARGFVEVNVIPPDARAAYNAKARRLVQQFGCNFCGATNHQRIGIRNFRVKGVFVSEDDVPSALLKEFYSAFTYLVRYDAFHRSSFGLIQTLSSA